MKKLFFLFFFINPSLILAQSTGSINIFSENGDKFYVFLDGKKQNDVAGSNIRIQGLPDLYYSARVVFADSSIASISKNNLYVSDENDVMRDAYYRIRREKGTRARLSFYSMEKAQVNFVPVKGMSVFRFGEPSVSETMPLTEIVELPPSTNPEILGSLNIFSQNADKFFVFLNGVKQNETAQSNVRIQDIPGLYYNVKIIFKDTRLSPITKYNLFISDGEDNLMDAAYRIRRDKTGKPRLNFYSMNAVNKNYKMTAGMYVYSFGKSSQAIASTPPTTKPKLTFSEVKGTISNIKVTESFSPAKSTGKPVAPGNTKKPVEEKSNASSDAGSAKLIAKANTAEQVNKTAAGKTAAEKTAPENKKCNGWPMGKGDLDAAKKIIEQAEKEEEKLTAAQEIIASNCLLSSQVTEFCSMFKSEKSRLAFAKYAYKFTIDRKNYAAVNKALSLETSKRELSRFINGG